MDTARVTHKSLHIKTGRFWGCAACLLIRVGARESTAAGLAAGAAKPKFARKRVVIVAVIANFILNSYRVLVTGC